MHFVRSTTWKEEAAGFSDGWEGIFAFDFLSVVSVRISPPKLIRSEVSRPSTKGGSLPELRRRLTPPIYLTILLLDAKNRGRHIPPISFRKRRFIAYATSNHDGEVFPRFC